MFQTRPTGTRGRSGRRPWRATVVGATVLAILAGLIGVQSVAAVDPITAFTVDGEPGTWPGLGVPQVYRDSDSTIVAVEGTTPGYLGIAVTGNSGDAAGHSWHADIAAPPGSDLAIGTYPNAVRASSRGPGQPGIDIGGDGRGCGEYAGSFEVHEIAFTGGSLSTFAATYAFQCDNQPGWIRGEIRFNSQVGFQALLHAPHKATFPDTAIGETAAPVTLTVRNAGSLPIAIASIGLSGPASGDFDIESSTCPASLLAGGLCEVPVDFSPTVPGDRIARLDIDDDTISGSHVIALQGLGQTAFEQLMASPNLVDFGTLTAGSPPVQETVTITNTGNVGLTIDLEIAGGQPASFSIASEGCPDTLGRGESCQVVVRYTAVEHGSIASELRIHSAAPESPLVVPLYGTGILPASGLAWGTTHKAGPAYTWNSGNGLARTVSATGQKLHVVYATDRVKGKWARNSGPYMGIYYVRSSTGAKWSTPKRLNPTKQHAARVGVAAAGSRVYVTWVSQTRLTGFKPKARRVLYVRVNTKHGAAAAWRSIVRLTSTTGRVDFPTIAASGADVYVAFTDSVTGSVRLAISHNRGVTWARKTLGSTTASTSEGRTGEPSVAVSGANVVVAWSADAAGTVAVRRSTDRGVTWLPIQIVTGDSGSTVNASARGSRVAVVWTTGTEIHLREAIAGTWGPDRLVSAMSLDSRFAYSPSVVLQGTTRVAVAWSERLQREGTHTRLRWTESANDGALWFQTQTLAATSSAARRTNDWPSVIWPSESQRHVLWGGWSTGTNHYRLYIRTGTGAPVGSAAAAVSRSDPAIDAASVLASRAFDRIATKHGRAMEP